MASIMFYKIGILLFIAVKTVYYISAQQTEIRVPKVGNVVNEFICQGKSKNLSCSNETEVMVIYRAQYGREKEGRVICRYDPFLEKQDKDDKDTKCGLFDVTEAVSNLCHKESLCDVPSKNEILGRPCKGVYKYLVIMYACGFPHYVRLNATSNTTALGPNATSNGSNVITLTSKPPTMLNATVILPVVTAIRRRTPLPRSTASYVTPYVRGKQSNALELGISGRLLIWFLHFRANETSYVAVFVVAALCAVVLFGIVFGRCWYLRRRTKSQNFAVLHKPKRFFDPTMNYKQSNGHAGRRASRDQANEELLTEKTTPSKTEVVITRADVETTQPSRRPSRSEGESSLSNRSKQVTTSVADEGDGNKPDNSTFYVNPMYDKNRAGNTSASASNIHPRVPATHRLSNASEPGKSSTMGSPARSLSKQQMRCNSMGNLPRSHHSSMQRRHPSAGNVAANKDGLTFEPLTYPPKGSQHSQQGHMYNSPQLQPYQSQGSYQGQGQGGYQGQPPGTHRQPPGTPSRAGPGGYPKSPISPRPGMSGQPMGSPAKAPQRNRPMGPGGVPYQSPGPPAMKGTRPNSPYEYGTTENTPRGDMDTGRRYHGNEAPQWESNPHGDRVGITVNPSQSSNGPAHYRSNGRLHRRESYENIKPFDNLPDPMLHGEHRPGETRKRLANPTVTDPLISPLDTAPVGSNRFRSHERGRQQGYQYPAPPDQGSDSSDDDLYSLVAKGNYDSVINDPLNVRQTFRSENKKHRHPVGKHSAGRAPGRMFSDTSV
ncbi:uncharacterized protein LOC110249969 isoform X2 [Exaiptasia diaphana]|uniref:SUEL-type lectin domain-containing protein n=1 Tax=Exaiptasia diaphana TaxID=2652724 RepID=A0A913XYD1_EXADI|nr:uncharacterized protein LOC110249969 isoform X2 [Exaiptasia diaphana]